MNEHTGTPAKETTYQLTPWMTGTTAEQSRLTDAELNALLDRLGGCKELPLADALLVAQVTEELRELREQNVTHICDGGAVAALKDDEIARLREENTALADDNAHHRNLLAGLAQANGALIEQNTALVAALDEMLEYPGDEYVLDRAITLLASVKGEQK